MRRKAFTLIELLVVVAIIALLISILLPSLARARELSKRSVCAANLKGIGTACATYANDSEQVYPIPGASSTNQSAGMCATGFSYLGIGKNPPGRTVVTQTNSLVVSTSRCFWMLIRDGATAPKQFICPSSDQTANQDTDPMLYYDFLQASELSYGIQVPFGGNGKPTTDRDPRMPLAADRGPFSPSLEKATPDTSSAQTLETALQSLTSGDVPDSWKRFNSPNHGGQGDGEGENVLYSDFHVEFVKKPIEGIGYDNIYTRWEAATGSTTEVQRVRGRMSQPSWGNAAPFGDNDSVIYP